MTQFLCEPPVFLVPQFPPPELQFELPHTHSPHGHATAQSEHVGGPFLASGHSGQAEPVSVKLPPELLLLTGLFADGQFFDPQFAGIVVAVDPHGI